MTDTATDTATVIGETIAHRICPLCEACCGLEVRSSEGRVQGIRGHAADVFSAGYLCPKAYALKDLHDDPDRLRRPLVKRAGRFVEVGWDEAFAEIEARLPPLLAAHGRDAVALTVGNPAAHQFGLLLYFARLARALGSKNLYSASTLDQMPKQLASGLMYGHWFSVAVPDIERCELLLVLGANPMTSNGSLWTVPGLRHKLKALKARGGALVVIDPRRTETAELADLHLAIRPGADVLLLAALVQVLFADDRVRLGRLAPWLAGVDALREATRAFTPERVAARCGIEAAAIRALAHRLADAGRACVYGRIGTCTQAHGTAASWLIDVLNALTGHLDEPGGAMFPQAAAFAANTLGAPGRGRGISTGRHASRVSAAPEVLGELPMVCLAEEIETAGPGQVRALISVASNPVLSAPNGGRLAAALDQLDFMVSLDIYLNETTRHADVILPGGSPLEQSHYDIAFTQFSHRNHARYSRAVLAPPDGQPPEWQNLLRLAAIVQGAGAQADVLALDDRLLADELRRLAPKDAAEAARLQAELSPWRGPDRLLELALRSGPHGDGFGARPEGLTLQKLIDTPAGIDLGALQPRLPQLLRTPSGQVELAPPSLLADLERATAELDRPVPALVIVGRRDMRSNNSWMHNLPTLAKGAARCTLLLHPADAQRHGLADGALARITGAGGRSVEAPVQLSTQMLEGVASLPHGWGHDLPGSRLNLAAQRPGANLNLLLDDAQRDPLSGNAVLSGIEVQISPA